MARHQRFLPACRAGFVIIATGATLFINHRTVNTAIDAAFALQAFAGHYASLLFGIGLFGASLLAAVLPLSTAYGICEAFGFERGVSRSFSEAPVFQSIFTGLIILGVLITMIPGLPIIQVLVVLQDLNAAMLPILLIFIILLVNNRRLMGRHVNNVVFNVIAWTTTVVISILIVLLLLSTIFNITLWLCFPHMAFLIKEHHILKRVTQHNFIALFCVIYGTMIW